MPAGNQPATSPYAGEPRSSEQPEQFAHGTSTAIVSLVKQASRAEQPTITVGKDGAFIVSVLVGPDWHVGQHTITASELFGWSSATFSFKVKSIQQVTNQPKTNPNGTSTSAPAASSAAPNATTLGNTLPSVVAFGAAEESSNQLVSSQIALQTSGTESVSWNASWDQTQAPWLRLEQTSGKIQAPMSQIVTVQAQSNGLQVGNYTATVTFTASPGNKSLALTVNLSVQPGCIDTNPIELTFISPGNTFPWYDHSRCYCGTGQLRYNVNHHI